MEGRAALNEAALRRRRRGERAKTPCADAVAPERGLVFSGTYTLPGSPIFLWRACRGRRGQPRDGAVRILRYVGAHDCGRIVNPRLVEGQIIGGIAQGLGQALCEDVVYSPGQLLTGSLLDYALPEGPRGPSSHPGDAGGASPTNRSGRRESGRCPRSRRQPRWPTRCWTRWPASGCHLDTPLTAEKVWRAMQGGGK